MMPRWTDHSETILFVEKQEVVDVTDRYMLVTHRTLCLLSIQGSD